MVKALHGALLLVLLGPATSAQTPGADDFLQFDPAQARLGRLLFYDKILSGNRNISCGTCHHHALAGADGVSLGIGQGGEGLGPARRAPDPGAVRKRIPRNAPALWNLGHREVRALFHDGRVSVTDHKDREFATPAGDHLPRGLNSILAAQALFPLTSPAEMAGFPGENPVSDAVQDRIDGGWEILAARVRAIPGYHGLVLEAFPGLEDPEAITIVEIANALAAFIGTEWQSVDSPYDAWLRDGTPLPDAAERGRLLFFGRANCASCHDGALLTDHGFHAMGLPQFGPGRTRAFDPMPRDVGRMGVTDRLEDAYRFRTPSLRNVALTAPYGHNGAYPTLSAMIRHMANPVGERLRWETRMARLPDIPWLAKADFLIRADRLEMARQAEAVTRQTVALTAGDVADIEAFLHALTGRSAADRPLGRPDTVPSGLPVD